MSFEQKAAELFVDFPVPPVSHAGTIHVRRTGNLLYVGGALPLGEGKIQGKGRLGLEVTLDQGRTSARVALIQALGMARSFLGSLDKIKQVVKMTAFVASGTEFTDHNKVLDSASQLLADIFGNSGVHVRTAIGVTALPQGACVQIELIIEVK